MNKYSLSALLAAGLLAGAATSASAADLGGNCCADLEERIAELEATTVRKGNRKVSLTISGWVGEQLTWWDDGHERNAYVTGLGGTLATHITLSGNAKINSDVSAGYTITIEANSVDALLGVNQNRDDSGSPGASSNTLNVRESYWYLKSNSLGTVSVGQQSPATDNLAILTDGSGSLVQANWVLFEGAGFFLRNSTAAGKTQTTLTWGDGLNCFTFAAAAGNATGAGIGGDCTGAPLNAVKYVSPTFGGFSVSAAWGEDDFWDVAGKWAGELAGFKLALAAGYSQNTDNTTSASWAGSKTTQVQIGAYLQHIPTGLFVHGAWLREDLSGVGGSATHAAFFNSLSPEHWYVKGGLRQKFTPFGHTVIYGEYSEGNNQVSDTAWTNKVIGSNVRWWGAGIVQEIDAAAMSMWIKYRNVDGDLTLSAANAGVGMVAGKNSLDSLQMVTFGAMISF